MGPFLEYLPIVVGVAVGVGYPVAFLLKAVRADRHGDVDRTALLDGFLVAALALLFAWLWVPWHVVPPAVWALLVAVVVYAVIRAGSAWRAAPWASGDHPRRQLASTAAGGAVIAAIFVAVIV